MGDPETYDDETHCGHDTADGSPCLRTTGGELCWDHADDDRGTAGRPTKLTKQREEQIAQALESGRSFQSACRMAGIAPSVGYNWLDRGEGEEETIYSEFQERITRAKGHGEEWYFNTVVKMAEEEGDHRFLASLMKQRYPDAWQDTETGVDAEGQVVINVPESVTKTWPQQPDTN